MASKSRINVVSERASEFSGNITTGGITYHIQTEDLAPRRRQIVSKVYLKGEVVFIRNTDYSHIPAGQGSKVIELIDNCHKSAIRSFLDSLKKKEKSRAEYFSELQEALAGKDGNSALEIIEGALEKFPTDPLLLSQQGLLVATFRNEPKEGIKICRNALAALKETMPLGSEFFSPILYLNLGRAYLAANRKREAISAFREGLRNDPENADLAAELQKMGSRRRKAVPFLERSHPINKYVGKLMSRVVK